MIREREQNAKAYRQGYQWIVFYYSVKDVAYDVQKTDSLVSPYLAYVEFKVGSTRTDWLLKSQAEADDSYTHFKLRNRASII